MTKEQFQNLKPGDIIQHATLCPHVFKVTDNSHGKITAECIATSEYPAEWHLLIKDGNNQYRRTK